MKGSSVVFAAGEKEERVQESDGGVGWGLDGLMLRLLAPVVLSSD